MKIVFNKKRSNWKIDLESKRHSLNTTDFLVLTGLRDRNDRKFHNISELIFTSKLQENYFRRGLKNLKKTSLIMSNGNAYKISDAGKMVVDMIRRDEVETLNSKKSLEFSLESLKKMLRFGDE